MSSSDELSAVVVAVRVRPFNSREIARNAKNVITMDGPKTTISNPDAPDDVRSFTFDFSYWSFDRSQRFHSQEDLYHDIGTVLIKNAFKGFNCSIFAYGQTGSGKSFSMMGYGSEKADEGIIPRICNALFETLNAQKENPE